MLTITNASKKFDRTIVLDSVNLEIPTHALIGLAGSSGSGKSTLLRCIQGLDKLDSGSITNQATCGFMFQDFQLFPHMNVLENLTYAPHATKKSGNHQEQAHALLATLGIADKAQCFPAQLSGGQKQRVALARSLMMQPGMLLCDEPTSGLDVATIQDVTHLLKMVRNTGVTMIIASHDLDFLTQLVDRIIILKNGLIAANVSPSSLHDPVSYLKNFY